MPTHQLKQKALVVDDDHQVADTLVRLLQHHGFEATAVYNGTDAITSARDLRPDVVITDVHMSGMNGLQVGITIRKSLPSCRVLILSGSLPSDAEMERAMAQGYSFEILTKPVHPQELLAKLALQ